MLVLTRSAPSELGSDSRHTRTHQQNLLINYMKDLQIKISIPEVFLTNCFFFYVWDCFTCICVCAPGVWSSLKGQERKLDLLELKLHIAVSCYVGDRNWTWSSGKAVNALTSELSIQSPFKLFFFSPHWGTGWRNSFIY